jgi:beta-glucosidase
MAMSRSLQAVGATALAFAFISPVAAQKAASPSGSASNPTMEAAERRAAEVVRQMRTDEKTILTRGTIPAPIAGNKIPEGAIPAAGYVPGIARLGVPALLETDASLGIAWFSNLRRDKGATALPSALAMASSWNTDLIRKGGAMIGSEARAKGFNVLLAGGVNLVREPRAGRNFEYFSEDPLLSGELVGAAINGVQSNNIISTIKHYALNDQETARFTLDVKIGEAAARESDLLAFQIGIERGNPGSVMCAYNLVNGHKACNSDWLLNTVLKEDWGYKGFVMSDWGAVPGTEAAMNGLDQQSAAEIDAMSAPGMPIYFGDQLAKAAAADPKVAARVDDMNKRILTAIYANGLDKHPVKPGDDFDRVSNAKVAEEVARQGLVLLRNERGVLPLAASVKRIAVIGGFADRGVLSGGGSSQVNGEGGPTVLIPAPAEGPIAQFVGGQSYNDSSPYKAIRARAGEGATVIFNEGRYIVDAVNVAKQADVVIVFGTQWATEGSDVPDLSLPSGQDELIDAVTRANPKTVVVLETGGPVLMPWLEKSAAVLQAWYPGARGGEAIAATLFGDNNPSGHLPVTFPRSVDQLPRPVIDGSGELMSSFDVSSALKKKVNVDYDIEGSDVGYRWFAKRGQSPLFPFGHGLSYTTFSTDKLSVNGNVARFRVRNDGQRDGATVGQLYLVSRGGEAKRRLVGFQRVSLPSGGSQTVRVTIDDRLLADWNDGRWVRPAGQYVFALGENAVNLGQSVTVTLPERAWRD